MHLNKNEKINIFSKLLLDEEMYFLFVLLIIFKFSNESPITYEDVRGASYKVSYDHRAITINGVRTMLISGAMHYPRSTPGMWPYLMKMAKNQGLNM